MICFGFVSRLAQKAVSRPLLFLNYTAIYPRLTKKIMPFALQFQKVVRVQMTQTMRFVQSIEVLLCISKHIQGISVIPQTYIMFLLILITEPAFLPAINFYRDYPSLTEKFFNLPENKIFLYWRRIFFEEILLFSELHHEVKKFS